MRMHAPTAALLAATALLAACSGGVETSEPVANEDAVPRLIDQTIGKTPTQMLAQVAGNYYSTFEVAKGLGGERAVDWDEERFRAEIAAALAPHAAQIDSAFARYVAADMSDGEGKRLLDLLAADNNAAYAACAFGTDGGETVNLMQSCAETTGTEPSDALRDSLGAFARRMSAALEENELMNIAVGYATCKVLADFGREVTNNTVSLDLSTTSIGIGDKKLPCTDYDELAAAQLTGEAPPNFPQAADSAQ